MEYLTIKQFAEKVGMSRWNVYKIIKNQDNNNLRAYPRHKIKVREIAGHKFIPVSEMERFQKGDTLKV